MNCIVDQAWMQQQLDTGRLVLPRGRFVIDRPLRTPVNKSGVQIHGVGIASTEDPRFATGSETRLVCGGGFPGPIFDVLSSEVVIDGISLDAGAAGQVGVKLTKTHRGLHSPGKLFGGVLICSGFRYAAIELGDAGNVEGNHCDEVGIDYLHLDRCARGMIVHNEQSMKHIIGHAHVNITPCLAEYEAGGGLVVHSATVLHKCDLLRLNDKGGIGSGNAQYSINHIKTDAQSLPDLRLVNMLADTQAHITVSDVRVTTPKEEDPETSQRRTVFAKNLAHLNGPAFLVLRDLQHVGPGSITSVANRRRETPIVTLFTSKLQVGDAREVLADSFVGDFAAEHCYWQLPVAGTRIERLPPVGAL